MWLPDGNKNFEDLFIRINRIHKCDRRMNGQMGTA